MDSCDPDRHSTRRSRKEGTFARRYTRRDFIATSAASGIWISTSVPFSVLSEPDGPSIYWSSAAVEGLRSVADVRTAVQSGRSAILYDKIRKAGLGDRSTPPITPSTPLPNRDEASIRDNSPDFWVTQAAGQRMLRSALETVIEDDESLRETALEQMEILFDETIWEGWIDKAHLRFGHPAGLRTGMLAEAVGLSYDWLKPYLNDRERSFIVDGLDRCAIRPFLISRQQDAWWLQDLNNWLTTIVGGVGIAAMSLGRAHPESDRLITYAADRMEEYLTIYGPKGEFNESVHYANATLRPVSFFQAYRYWSAGAVNRLNSPPFPETCRWQLYLTLPPGRVAAFGDARPEARPWTKHIAAVAAAVRDPGLQWFYETYSSDEADPVELLWFDEDLEAISPEKSGLPLANVFPAHGACVVSRSDWDPIDPACIVYAKAGREENHEHNDVGQVCIDGNGERLIIDIGSPKPTYPVDFFDEARYEYYNASIVGHNVLMIGGREQRYPRRDRGTPIGTMAKDRSGSVSIVSQGPTGTVWTMDLTPAYEDALRVSRSVIHFLPGIAVVADVAELSEAEEISLRWHTILEPSIVTDGAFAVETTSSRLSARVIAPEKEVELKLRRHAYHPPFDRGRGDVPLDQHHEPYVEAVTSGTLVKFLTLFAVATNASDLGTWEPDETGWAITMNGEEYHAAFNGHLVMVSRREGENSLSIEV